MGVAEVLQLAAGGLLLAGIAAFAFIRLRGRVVLPPWVIKLSPVFELFLLLAIFAAAFAWPLVDTRGAVGAIEVDFEKIKMSMPVVEPAGFVIIAAMIICFYTIRNRTALLLSLTVGPLLIFYGLLSWKFFPVLAELQAQEQSELWKFLQPKVRITIFFPALRHVLIPIAAILGGLYCSRWGFARWKFFAGAFTAALAVGYLAQPFLLPGPGMLIINALVFAVAAQLMIVLPGSQRRLESLTGLRLGNTPGETAARPVTAFQLLLGHLALLLLGCIILSSTLVNWAERESMRMFYVEWKPTYRPPGKTNAFTDLSELFLKKPRGFTVPSARLKKLTDNYEHHVQDETYWSTVDANQARSDMELWSAYIKAYETGAEKDYYEESVPTYVGPVMDYTAVRECSRVLRLRALLNTRDGRTTEALSDIRSVILFGGLLNDHPTLLSQMIGKAVREIGLTTAYDYYTYFKADAPKLRQLAELLDEVAPKSRTSVNAEALKRGEPFTLPVGVWTEIFARPSVVRAEKNSQTLWLNFDALRVATALEVYRADHGAYPDSLERLRPNYLRTVPVDPFKGRPLDYTITAGGFSLDSPARKENPFQEMFMFPPLTVDEHKAKQEASAAKKGRKSPAKAQP